MRSRTNVITKMPYLAAAAFALCLSVSPVKALAIDVEKDFIQALATSSKSTFTAMDWYNDPLRKVSTVMAERVDIVKTESHTEIIPEYTAEGLKFKLRYDAKAIANPKLAIKDLAMIAIITSGGNGYVDNKGFKANLELKSKGQVESPHAIAELLTNVQMGSVTAKARWVQLQVELLKSTSLKPQFIQDLGVSSNIVAEIRAELETQLPALEAEATKLAKKQQKELDSWKKETQALDKYEAMEEKLNDLILKNDRKGVRKMLEAYLPWALMEPVEANTWKMWLDAIENPSKDKTTVAFRGVSYDTDKIQRRQTAHGEVYGFMSTVLTKNQGNYTRRLRSLVTNREKNGDHGFELFGSKFRSGKMTDQMTQHARDPVASSFLSFTYDPGVAYGFIGKDKVKIVGDERVVSPGGGLLAVKMDSRRLVPNLPSMYGTEIELLAPLIIFPDEIIKYEEGSRTLSDLETFVKEITAKTGVHYNLNEPGEAFKKRYAADGYEFLAEMNKVKSFSAMSCSKIF
ncbi:hypothetical protein [Bdellovibrio reynosensis]|uniref:Uncharacterized protein n=1 Tax=Bdellovibrio reynosensis TaxID=2835041 RepID=A0ABY4CDM6_9BACT|nr:hypothetical protein [Bdellovibrio reynosensis]UOF01982.1 hypothetical protein MNR06_03315 [Bdellovibrio reynosensis]